MSNKDAFGYERELRAYHPEFDEREAAELAAEKFTRRIPSTVPTFANQQPAENESSHEYPF